MCNKTIRSAKEFTETAKQKPNLSIGCVLLLTGPETETKYRKIIIGVVNYDRFIMNKQRVEEGEMKTNNSHTNNPLRVCGEPDAGIVFVSLSHYSFFRSMGSADRRMNNATLFLHTPFGTHITYFSCKPFLHAPNIIIDSFFCIFCCLFLA